MVTCNIQVAVVARAVYLRLGGRATFNCSADFKRLIVELLKQDKERFVLDLEKCLAMDSTFLGVLISFLIGPTGAGPKPGAPAFEVCRANSRIWEQFENLGVAKFFKVIDRLDLPDAPFNPVERSGEAPSKEELTRTSLEAHQALMKANPENVLRFKDVVKFLSEDIDKKPPTE